nr:hypothetical protein [Tanacetum cinerariifolium]
MGFVVYQIDVKSAFLYGTIKEEVYICQPPGFEDPDYLDKVYKVVKALYGLHQAPRAWYETLANYLLENDLCKAFEKHMKDKFQMSSMGELTFFLGLQVKQKKDGIFISHDKYVAEILRKFRLTDGKSASTPTDTEKPLLKDLDGVSTPKCDEDRLELIKLMVFLLPSDEKVGIEVSAVDLQVSTVRLILLLLLQKFLLFDKKKMVITEASIRDSLCLDDAEGVECLPNKEIFTELARMGYEKPSAKLTLLKEFFSSQWKFLIHTILQCMSANFVRNADSPTKFYMYPRFLQLMIRKQVGDLSLHSTKYTSLALTQKEAGKDVDEVHAEDVNIAGVVTKGAASDDVNAAVDEPSIPSLKQPTPPPQLSQDIPSTSQDKIAQALEITKLKSRVKKFERRNKASKIKRLKKDAKDVFVKKSVDVDESVGIQWRTAESQAQIYQIDLEHANKVLSMQDEEESKPAKIQEVVDVVTIAKIITEVVTAASDTITVASTTITAVDVPIPTAIIDVALTLTAAPSRKRNGVVIKDPQETATPSTLKHSESKSKDKGKGILRKQKVDKDLKRYHALKRKPQTEAQARKNMMIYLKNVAGFKMDYFKGMSYDDIRLIFEKQFDSNVAFLQKTKERMDEEDSRALKRMNESQEEKVERRYPLIRFTLDQMLNNVQLEVEEESEVSWELLSYGVDVAMDFKKNMLSV